MMRLFSNRGGGLDQLPDGSDPAEAVWIDVFDPDAEDAAALAKLGIEVPSFAEMREIEVSSRLYRKGDVDHMTVVMPGRAKDGTQRTLPVTFIVSDTRLVSVRYHAPKPFDTYPARAGTSVTGCADAHRIALGFVDEVVGRQADRIEEISEALDTLLAIVLAEEPDRAPAHLRATLRSLGLEGEKLGRLRLTLLSLERLLSFHHRVHAVKDPDKAEIVESVQRDIQALVEHSEALSERIAFANDLTLGLIQVDQNTTMRTFSIITAFFMPPTLIASMYGMNFSRMPELDSPWGYPVTLMVMVGSSVLAYLIFKWRRWL